MTDEKESKLRASADAPEEVLRYVVSECLDRILEVKAQEGFSPEERHKQLQKYYRILNDAVAEANKLKMGNKKDFDLAAELLKLADQIGEKRLSFGLERMIARRARKDPEPPKSPEREKRDE